MLIFVIAVVIVIGTIIAGMVLAAGTAQLDTAVKQMQFAIENKDRGYNPAATFGHRIHVQADSDVQMKEARLLAAKRAAALPRGANMGIGRLGSASLISAGKALEKDPQTAVKIASFHGWDGAKTGYVEMASAGAPAAVAAVPTEEVELVPGKDYQVIEISDEMSPAEKRKARITNAKAKSAAMKAAKASQTAAGSTEPVPSAQAAEPQARQVTPAAAANLPAPPTLIDITDDMSPDEKRKARIANAKAKSAYNKALKEAGGDVGAQHLGADGAQAELAVPASTAARPTATAAAPALASQDAAGVPEPDYVELTDDMSPDEKRKARIQNAKARSAYNKALKAAGIDPKADN